MSRAMTVLQVGKNLLPHPRSVFPHLVCRLKSTCAGILHVSQLRCPSLKSRPDKWSPVSHLNSPPPFAITAVILLSPDSLADPLFPPVSTQV